MSRETSYESMTGEDLVIETLVRLFGRKWKMTRAWGEPEISDKFLEPPEGTYCASEDWDGRKLYFDQGEASEDLPPLDWNLAGKVMEEMAKREMMMELTWLDSEVWVEFNIGVAVRMKLVGQHSAKSVGELPRAILIAAIKSLSSTDATAQESK